MSASPFIVGGPRKAFSAFVTIVASDTVNQSTPINGIRASGAGTVSLVDSQGNIASLTLTANTTYDLPPTVRVNVAGTTATGLVGFA